MRFHWFLLRHAHRTGLILFVCSSVLFEMQKSTAADFCVITQLYTADKQQLLGENRTVFHDGKVYDFPANGDQITCFEGVEHQFIVLDAARRTWTRIRTDQLLQYTALLKAKSRESDDPLLRFCSEPKFDTRSENDGKKWFFDHPMLQYQVEAITLDDPLIGLQYRTFSDWYARLNAMLRPQSLPPFPRLLVNQKLVQQNLLPREVQLRLSPSRHIGDQGLTVRSVHQLQMELSEKDLERLAWVIGCRQTFSEARLMAYRTPTSKSAVGARAVKNE